MRFPFGKKKYNLTQLFSSVCMKTLIVASPLPVGAILILIFYIT
jgi:hypothetical protein